MLNYCIIIQLLHVLMRPNHYHCGLWCKNRSTTRVSNAKFEIVKKITLRGYWSVFFFFCESQMCLFDNGITRIRWAHYIITQAGLRSGRKIRYIPQPRLNNFSGLFMCMCVFVCVCIRYLK